MKVIFIKHARPEINPNKLPEEWPLSEEGRAAAGILAERLTAFNITQIFHSDEMKAVETADVISKKLNAPAELRQGIHEHDRSNVPHMRSGEFISYVELFFRKPSELVLGKETADECLARYSVAVESLIAEHKSGDLAIVTHGTALSLYLATLGAGKPFEIWRRMGLPSYAVVDAGTRKVSELVDRVM